ncbi:MAG: hypothetical protein U5K51_00080 [Flavobacteriaceae bacterium]|nr:hypothetical protein [Flavobacteriaceae bacterium]
MIRITSSTGKSFCSAHKTIRKMPITICLVGCMFSRINTIKHWFRKNPSHNRTQGNTQKIIEVGTIALENRDYLTAKDAFLFVLDTDDNEQLYLTLKNYLFQIDIALAANETDFLAIEKEFDVFFENLVCRAKRFRCN